MRRWQTVLSILVLFSMGFVQGAAMAVPYESTPILDLPPPDVQIAAKAHGMDMLEASRSVKVSTRMRTTPVSRGGWSEPQEMDMTIPINITVPEINKILHASPMQGMGEVFLDAAWVPVEGEGFRYVNPLLLVTIADWESGFGDSLIGVVCHNAFGIGAYDDTPNTAFRYESLEASVYAAARLLAMCYLYEDGRYYHGPTIAGVGTRWAVDPNWKHGITRLMARRLAAIEAVCLEAAMAEEG